ncbi:UDP-N-acetylmuramate dehydrogenase [Tumidithrix helvetica PCC 7403]|uniref:UDP-N-acetylmuramate dehydrogenase n=1 Tax=Tumidithrix helvetica TaxID=3457545 RepID=UPI003C8AC507
MITDLPADLKISADVPLASLTSMRVGGPAEWFISPRHTAELAASLVWAREKNLPITLIGAGSNLLISDRGLPGLVICTRYLRGFELDEQTGKLTAAAGEPVARLAWQAAAKGWAGFEWAVGIPGTVGGLVIMNAGAQGGCAADCVIGTETVDTTGQIEQLTPDDLNFSYRSSSLQYSDEDAIAGKIMRIVTGATIQLTPGFEPEKITAVTSDHLKYRHTTQPYNLPSCGSVFRNPYPHAAARLIEQAGLKGYQIGNAQVAQLHANFILNRGGATANDIFQLIQYIKAKVKQQWSVDLETEVKMLGHF